MSAAAINSLNCGSLPQCQFFVVRKKRLCRMTVRPGRQYCGEHEPEPKTDRGEKDTRVPCPYDPKHTCYISKLEKHLSICNARQNESPDYIEHNINAPLNPDTESCIRRPLSEIPRETLLRVIDKVNLLYEKHIEGNIMELSVRPIHPTLLEEFNEGDRTESSRRHMRQASSLLYLAEESGLVQDGTCYVELGAGKGQLSYYVGVSWCGAGTGSCVLCVDRAAMRHKRDNRLRHAPPAPAPTAAAPAHARLRADLAHLRLGAVPAVRECKQVVGLAKHLCGVATDYALRCVTGADVRTRGLLLATCCHHRCHIQHYVGMPYLQELGITGDEFNIMLGVVSWATCGDGRSRERRAAGHANGDSRGGSTADGHVGTGGGHGSGHAGGDSGDGSRHEHVTGYASMDPAAGDSVDELDDIDRLGKHLVKQDKNDPVIEDKNDSNDLRRLDSKGPGTQNSNNPSRRECNDSGTQDNNDELRQENASSDKRGTSDSVSGCGGGGGGRGGGCVVPSLEAREECGRRAKALVDWGRVGWLRARGAGVGARLARFVPPHVSQENVCIVAVREPPDAPLPHTPGRDQA